MLEKYLPILLLFILSQPVAAEIVDQELKISSTVTAIGAQVPEPFQSGLSIGEDVHGTITAQGVDTMSDGYQNTVTLVDFVMSIAGVSFDSAVNHGLGGARVQGGEVVAIDFVNDPGVPGAATIMSFQSDNFMRIIFPGWNLSSPTNFEYEINFARYSTQVVPEPSTLASVVVGLLGTVGLGRRRHRT